MAHSNRNISLFSTVLTGTGLITLHNHAIRKTLKIFDQMMFPIAISVCLFLAAMTEVTSSGTDVPIATILAPIMIFDTPNISANILAYSTIKSPHTYNPYIPNTINISDFHILIWLSSGISVSAS